MKSLKCSLVRFSLFAFLTGLCLAPVDKKKAVYETSEKDGFKVSVIGLQNLDVATQPVPADTKILVPYNALVFLKDKIGVYRLRGEWYKLVFVGYERKGSAEAIIRSKELATGDSVVVKGAALMRVAESNAFGGEE